MTETTEIHPPLDDAATRAGAWMDQFDSAIVAYSGGVDSALVLALAHGRLAEGVLACIGVSPSYPERELEAAVDLAKRLGARYRLVRTDEHLDPRYAANPVNRCYFCKSNLYGHLRRVADEENISVIFDGTNASDLGEIRPGYRAAQERGVRSPLAELGLEKNQVRALARQLGLPIWNKPAMPCLASRVPHGVAVVPALLSKIASAETVLFQLGFTQFRVRHHGDVARIELPAEEFARAIECRETLVCGIRAAGYRFVSLDLGGFKSGSLSQPIVSA
ncbi:MAG TPA: ATP-dependent sacrificial sulfur transferase LarE [Tepidisphaeraceae bacterium]|jgi:uncharacterized protein|nr:ATP-dependent sacrificial sulfur transferase LarE [Tepidisphaeraceae bacterium]